MANSCILWFRWTLFAEFIVAKLKMYEHHPDNPKRKKKDKSCEFYPAVPLSQTCRICTNLTVFGHRKIEQTMNASTDKKTYYSLTVSCWWFTQYPKGKKIGRSYEFRLPSTYALGIWFEISSGIPQNWATIMLDMYHSEKCFSSVRQYGDENVHTFVYTIHAICVHV